jgi:beta-lactamase regulating signal transducer with metallopeptidase domain
MPWLSWILSNVALASILVLMAWFVQRRLRRPAVARILWVLALVKLITPPLLSVPLFKSPSNLACTLGACNCGPHAQMQSFVRDTLPWISLAIWSAGAGTTAWNAWRRWAHFRGLLSHASPAPPQWHSLASRLASELSLRRAPEILAVPGRLPPLVVPGWRRPRLLLPAALLGTLSTAQQKALLLHELVHIKRGDHLVRLLELTVAVAFWWLPGIGIIGRQLRACEEACCDAAVVAHLPQARRDYARLLLDVLDFANPLPQPAVPQATAMSVASDIEQRLHSILFAGKRRGRTWPAGALAVIMACAILPCKLHFDLVGRPAPAAADLSEVCEPAAAAIPATAALRQVEMLSPFCCPS